MSNQPTIRRLKAGRYIVKTKFIPVPKSENSVFLKFPYNKALVEEVRNMEKAKWHGFDEENPRKLWSIPLSTRNNFQLQFMDADLPSPYTHYDAELVDIGEIKRPLYDHQIEMVQHVLTRHYSILACEMGTGKTLVAIEAGEYLKNYINKDAVIWYVGPKSGVKAVQRELNKWTATFWPQEMITYESLVRKMEEFPTDGVPPQMVIFDECSKVKTPTAQRSKAAMYLADMVREYWGDNGYVTLMSGTPAPKSPVDWWFQCEVARPGFLREGTIHKFKRRLCIIEERESLAGGRFPHVVAWMDDTTKCSVCGQEEESPNHDLFLTEMAEDLVGETPLVTFIRKFTTDNKTTIAEDQLRTLAKDLGEEANLQYINFGYHPYFKSKNEVQYLYERMHGLVLVKFKKDCLDIPEKQYEIIRVKPTAQILRAAKIIKARSSRTITALTLLRELSDGFQYDFVGEGEEDCPKCKGLGEVTIKIADQDIDTQAPIDFESQEFSDEVVMCDRCGGTKLVPKMVRTTDSLDETAKDRALIEILEDHEDVGRLVVWGGFTGTIDRLVQLCHRYGWATLRVDGRGYSAKSATDDNLDPNEMLSAMDRTDPKRQQLFDDCPKLCFIGHPQAGGMALTLTASPTAVYYSNVFNGEGRMQSEDRIHRMGMDKNRGAKIIDLIHLPSDRVVLDNLLAKKKLQNISMGELADAIEEIEKEESHERSEY